MYNLVGFQTNLKFPEQKRVFSMIPGLEHAEFHRYGVMHRNSFLDSPRLLDADYHFRGQDTLYFAGQMTGVEGYMESAASGILAGKNLARRLQGKAPLILPRETMMGALAAYISSAPSLWVQIWAFCPACRSASVESRKSTRRMPTVAWRRWNSICVRQNNNTREIIHLEYTNRRIRR